MEIMEKTETGICASIDEIIDTYSDMIYRIILHHMRNDADTQDVLQDVFIKIMKGWPLFENKQKEKAWILRVAMNTCKDHWKYERLRKHEDIFDSYACDSKDHDDFKILPYVMRLPQKYRDVIYLYYYEEYSVKEIAKLLHKKEATILTWLRRARKRLKDVLEGSDWHEYL